MPSPSPDTRLDDALDRANRLRQKAADMRELALSPLCLNLFPGEWAAAADKLGSEADVIMSAMKDKADA